MRIPIRKQDCPWLAGLFLLALVAGCGGEPDPESIPELESLSWSPIAGSEHYTVRLWSGYRLLMEEDSRDTLLVLDANTRRTAAAFDSLSLEVLGRRGWDEERETTGRTRVRLRP